MLEVTDRLRHYPCDLSEAQWDTIKDLIPNARRGGRPRTTNTRMVINAILYLVNTGCAWRYLPAQFPPWKTVYHYYRVWVFNGTWRKIHEFLKKLLRRIQQRNEMPSYLIIDSQSIKAQRGEALAYDGFKKVRGRKRQILVDTMGFVHGVHIHAADLSDTKEGFGVFEKMSDLQRKHIQVLSADMGYRGTFENCFQQEFNFLPLIKRRENTGQGKRKTALEKKFWLRNREKIEQPKRWIVERTFAWFNGYRRLSRDYEKTLRSSETMIYIAMTQLMLRRIQTAKLL